MGCHSTNLKMKPSRSFWQHERELNFRLALQEEQKLWNPLPAWQKPTLTNLHFNLSCQNSEISEEQNLQAAIEIEPSLSAGMAR